MKQISNAMVRLSFAALLAALALSPSATATAVVTVAATTAVTTTTTVTTTTAVTTTEPVSPTLPVTTTVTDLGNNIFAVDGRSGGLPNLLSEQEVQTITKLQSAPLGPEYKILSSVSPDDQAVLARTGGDKVYFVNLLDGGVTPVQVERLTPLTNYVWLDDNTLGFLTTDPTSKANAILGASIDRRTGKVSYGEPQLAAIAALGSSKQVVAIIAPNLKKVLLIDSSEAKPAPAFQLPEPGLGAMADPARIGAGLAGGYGILPPNDTFLFSEGTKLRVVDVETGETHDVIQLGANPKVLDVSFSLDGKKFSVTSMWMEWNRILRTTGGPRLTDITYQDVTGALPPEENPYLQQNMVTILDFPSGEVSTLRAADGDGVFYSGASWSPDGQTLLVEAHKPGQAEGRRYPQYYPDFHSGGSLRFYDSQLDEVVRIERPEIDSSQLGGRFVSPDEVVIETRFGTNGHPYYYNLRTREFRNIADRAGVFFQVTPTNRSREIVFVFSSYTDPPEFHRIGLNGTGDTRLTAFNEEVRTVSQTQQHPVSFTLSDGSTWEGVLIMPADTPFPPKNLPIIVWQEGGPTSVVSNSWHATVESPQALLPNFGFGVLVVPLHGRYGVGPEAFDGLVDGNNFGQVDINAQAEIAQQLRERGWASKVGISGCSYGGYFVIQSLTVHPETYDAGHAMCTLTDLIVEWNTGDGILAPWAFGQTPWDILDEYRRDSPIYHAQSLRTPLLAFHGTKDFLLVDLMRNFMLQVINNGVPAKLLIFQDADHGFGRTAATLAVPYELYGAQEQILWFREYLVAGWSKKSHSNDADPNYDVVFPVDAVNTITITIAPDDWAAIQADMEELYGEERDRKKAFAEMTEEERAAAMEQRLADITAAAADNPLGAEFTRRSPMWVPATITFQGREWTHVGVRYKGASSLSPWMEGDMHLPFKFDFDKFEDDYPEIDNQRFYGFNELSLANNYEDPAGMRDAVVYELLAEAGLPSLRTAPSEIALDYGEGPVRLGLHTMVEVVDDTGIPSYFGSDDGNIYEGAGFGVSLSKQKAQMIEDSFEKKNNEDAEDWSDIWALYDALNSEKRTSDPEAWRADLEAVFDVDGFLEWLGIAAFVGHGDTYGVAAHNFYLYNNPKTGRLTWVSWDHNVTFRKELQPFLMLDKSNVSDAWPLIRYLLDDPVYWERYVELMAENFATVLAPDAVSAKILAHAAVIAPFATLDMSQEEYDAAVQALVDFVELRAAEVEDFLAGQE